MGYHCIDPERMKWLSWPSWLTCCGRFTHSSDAGRVHGQGKFAGHRLM